MGNEPKRARTKKRTPVWVLTKSNDTNGSLNKNGVGVFVEKWLVSDYTLKIKPRLFVDNLSI